MLGMLWEMADSLCVHGRKDDRDSTGKGGCPRARSFTESQGRGSSQEALYEVHCYRTTLLLNGNDLEEGKSQRWKTGKGLL